MSSSETEIPFVVMSALAIIADLSLLALPETKWITLRENDSSNDEGMSTNLVLGSEEGANNEGMLSDLVGEKK